MTTRSWWRRGGEEKGRTEQIREREKVKKMGRKRVPHRQQWKTFIALQLLCLQALAKQTCYQVWSKAQWTTTQWKRRSWWQGFCSKAWLRIWMQHHFGWHTGICVPFAEFAEAACSPSHVLLLLCRFLSLRLRHFHHLHHLHWHSSHHLHISSSSSLSLLYSLFCASSSLSLSSSLFSCPAWAALPSSPVSSPFSHSNDIFFNWMHEQMITPLRQRCHLRVPGEGVFVFEPSVTREVLLCVYFFFLRDTCPIRGFFLQIGGKPFFSITRRPSRLKNRAGVRRVLGLGRKGNKC